MDEELDVQVTTLRPAPLQILPVSAVNVSDCGSTLTQSSDDTLESILYHTCGRKREPMIITYDWIPPYGKPKPEEVREQLRILGSKDPSDDEVSKYMKDI
jgi:hypothetical protein